MVQVNFSSLTGDCGALILGKLLCTKYILSGTLMFGSSGILRTLSADFGSKFSLVGSQIIE